jgi:hypothetical protein
MNALPFALLLLMLINASSMFEFHMLVVAIIMFYILELIMQIVPNYPTTTSFLFSSTDMRKTIQSRFVHA